MGLRNLPISITTFVAGLVDDPGETINASEGGQQLPLQGHAMVVFERLTDGVVPVGPGLFPAQPQGFQSEGEFAGTATQGHGVPPLEFSLVVSGTGGAGLAPAGGVKNV